MGYTALDGMNPHDSIPSVFDSNASESPSTTHHTTNTRKSSPQIDGRIAPPLPPRKRASHAYHETVVLQGQTHHPSIFDLFFTHSVSLHHISFNLTNYCCFVLLCVVYVIVAYRSNSCMG